MQLLRPGNRKHFCFLCVKEERGKVNKEPGRFGAGGIKRKLFDVALVHFLFIMGSRGRMVNEEPFWIERLASKVENRLINIRLTLELQQMNS